MLISSLTLQEQERLAYIEGRAQTAALLVEVSRLTEEINDLRDSMEDDIEDALQHGFEQGYEEAKEDMRSARE